MFILKSYRITSHIRRIPSTPLPIDHTSLQVRTGSEKPEKPKKNQTKTERNQPKTNEKTIKNRTGRRGSVLSSNRPAPKSSMN